MVAVAANGARKTRQDHPALPITPTELANTAAACLEAGACMIHLHVRDSNGMHSLDAEHYRQAIKAIRDRVGDELIIQITTEAVGIYQPGEQMQAVREVKPEAVSLAIRELCPAGADETEAGEFFAWLYRERISPQYILYSVEDIHRFNELLARGLIPDQGANVLFTLGRYSVDQQSYAGDILPLLEELNTANSWWLCAFGSTEADCMRRAMELGGHCRVGFENNLLLPDGSVSPNNESLVSLTVNNAFEQGRPIATAAEARSLLGMV